jgi:hypothetical protein
MQAAADAAYVGIQSVEIRRLDTILPETMPSWAKRRIWMKLDTQGFEHQVLDGSEASLVRVVGMQIEMSLEPLYEHELPFTSTMKRLTRLGFVMVSIEQGAQNATSGQLLQFDGMFRRAPDPSRTHDE